MKLLYVNNKNAKIFQDKVKKQDAFVKYFSPTCPACIAMEEEWDDMCKDIDEKYNTDLILAQMDPTGMKELESTDVHTDVEFVPTIVILKNGKKHKEYNGSKNKEDMIKYLLDEKLIHPKMKGGSKTLKNTKNKKCSGNNFTNCCPHMPVNAKGEYTATTKSRPHILNLDGNKYRFYTCCMACKEAMTKLARENPKKFKSVYVKSIKGDKIYFKHKDTGKMVQIGTKIKSKTRKGGASARNILLKAELNNRTNMAIDGVEHVLRENSLLGRQTELNKDLFLNCVNDGIFGNCKNNCRKSPGLNNYCIPKNRKYNPNASQDEKDTAINAYKFLLIKQILSQMPITNLIGIHGIPGVHQFKQTILTTILNKPSNYEDLDDVTSLVQFVLSEVIVAINKSQFNESGNVTTEEETAVYNTLLNLSKKGGKKKTKKSKRSCIGKRDGKKGCRTCCKKKRKYKKCITRCMRGY
jgi:thiol-disulfide isomerase/thioredoxin